MIYLQKLTSRPDAANKEISPWGVYPGMSIKGEEAAPPAFGQRYHVFRGFSGYINTTQIMSIYVHGGESMDKLVLPSGFPLDDTSMLHDLELQKGDMLLATRNSIYLRREIKD